MASLSGDYNATTSLLPNTTGGEIKAMSGGGMGEPPIGYNNSTSLLSVGSGPPTPIHPFRGGGNPSQFPRYKSYKLSGGDPTAPTTTASTAAPTTTATTTAAAAAPSAPTTPTTTAAAAAAAAVAVALQSTTPTAATAVSSVASSASTAPTAPTDPTDPTAIPNIDSKKERKSKKITLFGEVLLLEDPRDNKNEEFTNNQIKALTLFGLEDINTDRKISILNALYDGECDTDKPLVLLNYCEPIRSIIQELAIAYLHEVEPSLKNTSAGITLRRREIDLAEDTMKDVQICSDDLDYNYMNNMQFFKKGVSIDDQKIKETLVNKMELDMKKVEKEIKQSLRSIRKERVDGTECKEDSKEWIDCSASCKDSVKKYITQEINSTAYILNTIAYSIKLLDSNEKKEDQITIKYDIDCELEELTGKWQQDKQHITIKEYGNNTQTKQPRLVMGFGPSASGKTFLATTILKLLKNADDTDLFPDSFISIDGGDYRKTSKIYQLVICLAKEYACIAGFENLASGFFQLFDTDIIKENIINPYLLEQTKKISISLYVPETLGDCGSLKDVKSIKDIRIKDCDKKYKSYIDITGDDNWIGLLIWQHKNAENCTYHNKYKCKGCTESGEDREVKEGKKYSNSSWDNSMIQGEIELKKAKGGQFKIHNAGREDFKSIIENFSSPEISKKIGTIFQDNQETYHYSYIDHSGQTSIKDGKKVNVYYVRHMYSCANFVRDATQSQYRSQTGQLIKFPFQHSYVQDPSLHCKGLEQAEVLGNDFNTSKLQIDKIYSSQLLRSIQSALIIRSKIGDSKIPFEIIPHINETGGKEIGGKKISGWDNFPEKIGYLRPYQINSLQTNKNIIINTNFSEKTNFNKFKNEILPKMVSDLIETNDKDEYNIIIVTHSGLLNKIFGRKLENGQSIIRHYTFTSDGLLINDKEETDAERQLKETQLLKSPYGSNPPFNKPFIQYDKSCNICSINITSSNVLNFLDPAKLHEFTLGKNTVELEESKSDNYSSDSIPDDDDDFFTIKGIPNPTKKQCYCISTIQFLFAIPELRSMIKNYSCDGLNLDQKIEENSTEIDRKSVICALKMVFEQLSLQYGEFKEENWIMNKSDKYPIDKKYDKYIIYIMKQFITTQQGEKLNSQQDASVFFRFLFSEIFDKENIQNFKDVLDIFRIKYTHYFSKENGLNTISANDHSGFNNFFTSLFANQLQPSKNTGVKNLLENKLTISNLLRTYSAREIHGLKEKQNYPLKHTYIVPKDTNKYLIISTNKVANSKALSSIDQSITIQIDPLITFHTSPSNNDDKKLEYELFGSILYTGSGAQGHYRYERFGPYNKTPEQIKSVLYNDSEVTRRYLRNSDINSASHLLIYKRKDDINALEDTLQQSEVNIKNMSDHIALLQSSLPASSENNSFRSRSSSMSSSLSSLRSINSFPSSRRSSISTNSNLEESPFLNLHSNNLPNSNLEANDNNTDLEDLTSSIKNISSEQQRIINQLDESKSILQKLKEDLDIQINESNSMSQQQLQPDIQQLDQQINEVTDELESIRQISIQFQRPKTSNNDTLSRLDESIKSIQNTHSSIKDAVLKVKRIKNNLTRNTSLAASTSSSSEKSLKSEQELKKVQEEIHSTQQELEKAQLDQQQSEVAVKRAKNQEEKEKAKRNAEEARKFLRQKEEKINQLQKTQLEAIELSQLKGKHIQQKIIHSNQQSYTLPIPTANLSSISNKLNKNKLKRNSKLVRNASLAASSSSNTASAISTLLSVNSIDKSIKSNKISAESSNGKYDADAKDEANDAANAERAAVIDVAMAARADNDARRKGISAADNSSSSSSSTTRNYISNTKTKERFTQNEIDLRDRIDNFYKRIIKSSPTNNDLEEYKKLDEEFTTLYKSINEQFHDSSQTIKQESTTLLSNSQMYISSKYPEIMQSSNNSEDSTRLPTPINSSSPAIVQKGRTNQSNKKTNRNFNKNRNNNTQKKTKWIQGIPGLTAKSRPSVLNNKRRNQLLKQENTKRDGNLTNKNNKNNKNRNTVLRKKRKLQIKGNNTAVRITRRNKRKNKLQSREFREHNKNFMKERIITLDKQSHAQDEKSQVQDEKSQAQDKNSGVTIQRRNRNQLIARKAQIKNDISKIVTKIQQQTELLKIRNYTKLSSNELESNSRKLEDLKRNMTEAERLAKQFEDDRKITEMLYNITTRYNTVKEKIQQSKNSRQGSKGYVKKTGNLFKK